MDMRCFNYTAGTSRKYWEVGTEGNVMRVRWGRIGTIGVYQDKPFASSYKARDAASILIRQKLAKGYVEVTVKPQPQPQLPAPVAAPTPQPVKAAAKPVNSQYFLEVPDIDYAASEGGPSLPAAHVADELIFE